MEGLRIGNRGDLDISWAARDNLGDFRASMLILGRQGQEGQAPQAGEAYAALALPSRSGGHQGAVFPGGKAPSFI